MEEKLAKKLAIFLVFLLLLFTNSFLFADNSYPNNDGEKWRIGYAEGEPFVNFAGTFHGLVQGFEEHGYINGVEQMPYSSGQEDSKVMWEWLVSHNTGNLEFVEDAYYSFGVESGSEEELLNRLESEGDLDLVITMGTYAGQILATDTHSVPVMVFSTTNAVEANIIDSAKDSGKDHIWAHMEPDREKRLIEVFSDLFDFEKMGIVYEDSDLARTYSAIDEIEATASERGFEIIYRHVDEPADSEDRERYYEELQDAYNELAYEIDAFYITVASIEASRLEGLLTPFYENNIPSFSQLGGEEVRAGAVASVSRDDFSEIGLFGSDAIIRVLEGELPRDQIQTFTLTPLISVNLEAAERVDYRVPFEVLLVADQVHQTIN
ncbi:ABC transporter substrate binding protein [Natranaerofaba carboxydovora]|uniref:ABC transporter substrate binding protein n=1 Tax=Natranaerofaba carboxydovora TaxID=2742683 RepID=UPI001F137CF2|nr:ABC transporter substrate binding protein [Natranaerofaba carboxydovora]UMZ72802.1 ABC transporter substrate binding protein [Natranaerofaba carboxydovora]